MITYIILLQEMCATLEVTDLDLIIPKLEQSANAIEAFPRLEQVRTKCKSECLTFQRYILF